VFGLCEVQEDLFKKEYGADAKGKGGQKFKSTFFMMVAERGINALVRVCMCLHVHLCAFVFLQDTRVRGGGVSSGRWMQIESSRVYTCMCVCVYIGGGGVSGGGGRIQVHGAGS